MSYARLRQNYAGDGLRVKKNDNGATTYYLRSSVLGGQVVAEMNGSGVLGREYVYLGRATVVNAGAYQGRVEDLLGAPLQITPNHFN